MLYNYLLTALRNFKKDKFYLAVNVFGLSVGITCCLVVYTILKHELTFDDWHSQKDQIYRVVEHYSGDDEMIYSGVIPNAMANALDEEKSMMSHIVAMYGPNGASMEINEDGDRKIFVEDMGIIYANSSLLSQMDFPVIRGAKPEVLDEPYKVFITQEIATKYFGKEDPIGRNVIYDETTDLEVVGILDEIPTNTNVPFSIVISYPTVIKRNENFQKSWGSYSAGTAYVVTKPGDDLQALEAEVNRIAHGHMSERSQERKQYFLQPMADIHLDTLYEDGVNYEAPFEVLAGFVLLASITLIASILNFVNLATAQAVQRSKEVGIRKTLGGSRMQVAVQFMGETFTIVLISTLLAFTFGQFFINAMNEFLAQVSFEIGYDVSAVIFSVGLSVIVTLLGGVYPAVILSGYSPISALNNQISLKKGTGNGVLRKSLVILQFVVANLLIISTIIVSAQMRYVKNKDLGFDPSNVTLVEFQNRSFDKIDLIKTKLEQLPMVTSSTRCMSPPQYSSNWNTNYWVNHRPRTDRLNTNIKFVDDQYLDTYQIPLLTGSNLKNVYHSDTTLQLVVNEEMIKRLSIPLDSAVGQTVNFMGSWRGRIVGVVEDFHMWSLQSGIGPVMMMYKPERMGQLNIKIQGDVLEAEKEILAIYREFEPYEPFMFDLLQDELDQGYIVENLVYGTFQIFGVMAIAIGIFGLYGLVSFMANRNRKSISIRKVFGASTSSILRIFGMDYLVMMGISFVLASPLAYLICQEWLNGFRYQIDIEPVYFLVALIILMVITIASTGIRSYQAATANPTDTLRYE